LDAAEKAGNQTRYREQPENAKFHGMLSRFAARL